MSPKPGVLSPKTSTQFSINILRTLQKKDPVMGFVGASPCHNSLIFMSTHKATPLGVSAVTKPHTGYCRPRGHFKKARPKCALHYRDY